MASTNVNRPGKRKPEGPSSAPAKKKKKGHEGRPPPPSQQQANSLALATSQETFLEELRKKHDVLVASVISSTKIKNRVARAVEHLSAAADDEQQQGPPRIVFFHARPAEVCKMITIVEKTRQVLAGTRAWQYNQLMEMAPRPQEPDVIEETVLVGEEEDEDEESDDGFEKTDIFERAINPPTQPKKVKTLAIFLSNKPVPELSSRSDVTVQDSDQAT